MTTPDPPPPAPLARPALLRTLELAVTAAVALVLALRPLSAGQQGREPETVFLDALIWLAAYAWGARALLAGRIHLPGRAPAAGLAAYLLFLGLAVQRALADGYGQAAWDLGMVRAGDLLLLGMLVTLARDRLRFRLFLSCLLAGAAAVAVYALYQRLYGFGYFRHVLDADPLSAAKTVGENPVHQRTFEARVSSDRVFGPFGYPNALAAYLLLLLPVLFAAWRDAAGAARRRLGAAGILGLAALVLSGSKAGFLAAKGIEWIVILRAGPAARRSWPERLRILGEMLAATAGALLLAALVYGAGGALGPGHGGKTLAQLVFALAWGAEIRWLTRDRQQRPAPRWLPWAGNGCLLLALGAGALFLSRPWGPPGGRLDRARAEVLKTPRVRAHYWIAALRMIGDYPVRGVGLDNYGNRYTQYKTPEGWAVRRAHNHYLQLAADGGIPLALAFCAFVAVLLLAARRAPPAMPSTEAAEPERRARQLRKLGFAAGLGAVGLTYFLYLRGLFAGLSLEFLVMELFGRAEAGSIRAATGDPLPALVHGAVHLVVLPGAWLLAFGAAWRQTERTPPAAFAPWLALGVLAVLVHALADFPLYIAAISLPFWAVAALAAGAGDVPRAFDLSRRTALVALLAWLAGGMLLIRALPLRQMNGAFAARAAETAREALLNAPPPGASLEEWKRTLELQDEALALRPGDEELHRRKAELLYQRLEMAVARQIPAGLSPEEAARRRLALLKRTDPGLAALKEAMLAEWRAVTRCNPYFADGYGKLARGHALLYPGDPEHLAKAAELLARAIELHPYKPGYLVERAGILRRLGRDAEAVEQARKALRLDAEVTDERARLAPREEAEARSLLQTPPLP